MLTLLASATFILWFSIIAALVIIISLELQSEGTATTAFSLAIALLIWNYGGIAWTFMTANILVTVLFIVGYLICGVIWSFLKWNEFVKSVYRKFKTVANKVDELKAPNYIVNLCEKLRLVGISVYSSDVKTTSDIANKIMPKGLDNKASIVAWISYWPLSLLGTLLNNPFRRLFEYTYSLVSGLYDKISANHKANALKNLE
jgi:hypothetical protein